MSMGELRVEVAPETIPTVNVPWIESPFFRRELARRASELTSQQRKAAVSLHEQGYAVVEQVVPDELCDRIRDQVDPMFEDSKAIIDRRVADAWRVGADAVRELAVLAPVQQLLRVLYERRPIPFQTLDFKWGTQQPGHADQIHFSSIPARYMCGVWVALEDVDEGNGPLFYYPGSHRLQEWSGYDIGATAPEPSFYSRYEEFLRQLMDELGIEPVEFHARKGDALVWVSNIVHGGRPVLRAGSTRWSQVTHYFFENCIYYQPHSSEVPTGELRMLDVVDLNTMERVPPSYNGLNVTVHPLGSGRSRLSIADGSPSDAAVLAPGSKSDDLLRQVARRLGKYRAGRTFLVVARELRHRL